MGPMQAPMGSTFSEFVQTATFERLLRTELIVEENDQDQRGIKQIFKKLLKGKNDEKDKRDEKTV